MAAFVELFEEGVCWELPDLNQALGVICVIYGKDNAIFKDAGGEIFDVFRLSAITDDPSPVLTEKDEHGNRIGFISVSKKGEKEGDIALITLVEKSWE